jgi:hypothetical protein
VLSEKRSNPIAVFQPDTANQNARSRRNIERDALHPATLQRARTPARLFVA